MPPVEGWPPIDGATALSRSGVTSPAGKLIARIDVPVSEDLDNALAALAAIAGVPKAEMGRRIWERAVWGEMSMLRRVAQGAGLGPSDESRGVAG